MSFLFVSWIVPSPPPFLWGPWDVIWGVWVPAPWPPSLAPWGFLQPFLWVFFHPPASDSSRNCSGPAVLAGLFYVFAWPALPTNAVLAPILGFATVLVSLSGASEPIPMAEQLVVANAPLPSHVPPPSSHP